MSIRVPHVGHTQQAQPTPVVGARLPHHTANARIDFVPGKPGQPGSESFRVTLYKFDPAIGKVEPGLTPTGRVKVSYNYGSSNVAHRDEVFTPATGKKTKHDWDVLTMSFKTGNVDGVRVGHLAQVQVELSFRGQTYWAPVDVAFN